MPSLCRPVVTNSHSPLPKLNDGCFKVFLMAALWPLKGFPVRLDQSPELVSRMNSEMIFAKPSTPSMKADLQTSRAGSQSGAAPRKLIVSLIASQLLLLALAIAWGVYMFLIAQHGEIRSTEPSSAVLSAEIVAIGAIALFSVVVLSCLVRWYLKASDPRQVNPAAN